MRATRVALASLILVAAWSATAAAHHSAIAFDFRKWATVEGVVKKFEIRNPHADIVLSVTDEKGTRDVTFEGHSRNNFYRAGWRPDVVRLGDTIKITYAMRKDGGEGGFVNSFVTAQGKEVGFQLPAATGGSPAGSK